MLNVLDIIDQHIPSLTPGDEQAITDKVFGIVGSALNYTDEGDVAELAQRTCHCGYHVEDMYDYVSHLKHAIQEAIE